ncbi:MAG: DNA gyrase subunit A [Candidatus Thermoplasmatota archaeon]|nr:DNA gyrase subunit A [Candidatus Thermoplasmatota archaeon]MCL5731566.1 DNA gyrase subunit A [Candidatus Thermoplasmatota archaeon]
MVQKRAIEEEIRQSYLEYAMSVIVSRAIPDARDGLKPVQRRILYAMGELSLAHNKPYKKSARIIGETMGKYHPHGDSAIYESLARMAQSFSMRYPLVDGQGNFGSIDGDEPAAMRYTEARLTEISEDLMEDMEKETVPFRLNFDGSMSEPEYFPSKAPQLLLNGSTGIAVGMATNLLPHNIVEICNAIKHYVDNPGCSTIDLMKFVRGPDFPGGGIIFHNDELVAAYETGRGRVITQSILNLDEDKRIIVESIPYGVNKAQLVEHIANLVRDDVISGITDIRDESDRDGIRVIIKIKDDDMKSMIVNQLLTHTQLESSLSINNLVLVNNQPRTLGLKGLIEIFVNHRLEIILKRSKYDLSQNKEREHILEGFVRALDNLDEVISVIRKSRDAAGAKAGLTEKFGFSEKQVTAILDMRLQRLTTIEREKILDDLKKVRDEIRLLEKIIELPEERARILKEEMDYLIKKYGDDRRTEVIVRSSVRRDMEELIPNESSVLLLSESGMIKRVSLDEYREQKRGGKGLLNIAHKSEPIRMALVCRARDPVCFFTSTGRVLVAKAYEIDRRSRTSSGYTVNSLFKLQEGETVRQMMTGSQTSNSLMIVTRRGFVKKISGFNPSEIRSSGLRIISLEPSDEVVSVEYVKEGDLIAIVSSNGKISAFPEKEARVMGRQARGNRGMRLTRDDFVLTALPIREESEILCVSTTGLGKRVEVNKLRVTHRNTRGIIIFKETERTGKIAFALPVSSEDQVMVMSLNKAIRVKISDISIQGRYAGGVKLIDLEDDDRVMSVARITQE